MGQMREGGPPQEKRKVGDCFPDRYLRQGFLHNPLILEKSQQDRTQEKLVPGETSRLFPHGCSPKQIEGRKRSKE